MGVEPIVISHPGPHFLFGVSRIYEVFRPRVDIGKSDNRIRGNPAISQQIFDRPLKLCFFVYSPVARKEINVGHLRGKSALQECQQVRLKGLLRPPFNQNGDLQARAPIRPFRQSSSSE